MSKKDYIALAKALVDARACIVPNDDAPTGSRYVQAEQTLEAVADRIADICERDSARFDRERFLRAALLGDFTMPKRTRAARSVA